MTGRETRDGFPEAENSNQIMLTKDSRIYQTQNGWDRGRLEAEEGRRIDGIQTRESTLDKVVDSIASQLRKVFR